MSDIFGRDRYAHLDAMGDGAREYLDRRAILRNHEPLNFDVIDPERIGHTRAIDSQNALGYTQTNWESIEAVVEEILYHNYMVRDFVPVNTNYPEGTQSIPIQVTDYAGEAIPITLDGSNVPNVDVNEWLQVVPSEYFGIKAFLKNDEVRTAMTQGIPLEMRNVQAATNVCIQKINEIVMTGAGLNGAVGLANLPTAATDGNARTTNSSAAFVSATAAQFEDDIQSAIERVISDTQGIAGEVFGGELCIIAPPAVVGKIGGLRIADTDASAWGFIRENNAWNALREGNSITLKSSIYMSAANNPGATKDRIAVYPKTPLFCELFELITPRIANQVQSDYGVSLPFEFKTSFLHVPRPDCMQYITSL